MRQIQTAAFGIPEYEPQREGTYRPRIEPRHLRHLWVMKQSTGKPITQLIADALDRYFETQKGDEEDG